MSSDMANFALENYRLLKKKELLSKLQLNRHGSTALEIVSQVKRGNG